jgi:hypothetical protein
LSFGARFACGFFYLQKAVRAAHTSNSKFNIQDSKFTGLVFRGILYDWLKVRGNTGCLLPDGHPLADGVSGTGRRPMAVAPFRRGA